MASDQLKQMNELYTSIKERLANPDIDLATLRDIAEKVHLVGVQRSRLPVPRLSRLTSP